MARYWIGAWAWIDSGNGGGYWQMPAGAQSALDLRSPVACATPVTPTGVGLFVTPNATSLGAGYTNLGTDPTALLTVGQRAALRTLLNLPRALSATDLQGILWEAMTAQADPDGTDRMLPLIPNGRRYELWLGGQRVRQVVLDSGDDAFLPFVLLLRRIYRQARQNSLDGLTPPNHYRKLLGYWVRKYGFHYRLFQPADVPDESDLPPETTISDNFNRADADALGTSSEGWSWTEVGGDIDIVSNKAQGTPDTPAYARAGSALSGNDNYAQCVVTTSSTSSLRQGGPACRADSSAQTYYWASQSAGAGTTGTLRIYKAVSGTRTALGTGTTQTKSGDTKKIEANGSTITAYNNGVSAESLTDSSITSGVYSGLVYERPNNLVQCDDFVAADLGVSGDAQMAAALATASALSYAGTASGGALLAGSLATASALQFAVSMLGGARLDASLLAAVAGELSASMLGGAQFDAGVLSAVAQALTASLLGGASFSAALEAASAQALTATMSGAALLSGQTQTAVAQALSALLSGAGPANATMAAQIATATALLHAGVMQALSALPPVHLNTIAREALGATVRDTLTVRVNGGLNVRK